MIIHLYDLHFLCWEYPSCDVTVHQNAILDIGESFDVDDSAETLTVREVEVSNSVDVPIVIYQEEQITWETHNLLSEDDHGWQLCVREIPPGTFYITNMWISLTSQIVGPFGAADLRFHPKIISALPCVSNYSHRSLTFPKKTFQANQFSTLRHVSNKAACKNSFDTFSEWLAYRKIKFIFSPFLSL